MGIYPRNPIVKANGVKWNTSKSDFPEIQDDINHINDPEGTRQNTSILVWMTPEQVKQKQIDLFNQRNGLIPGCRIYEHKNLNTEHKKVKQLKHRMVRGDVFTPLTFYHDRYGKIEEPQEGAHRTHAINELKLKKVPVWLHFQKGKAEGRTYQHYPETEQVIAAEGTPYPIGEKPDDIGDYGKKKRKRTTKFYGI
jgi:hypothetical protein